MSDNGPLSQILAEYLQALDAGRPPDPERVIALHPEHAAELRDFFARQIALFPPAERPAAERTFPSPFGPYTLLGEVGRGGMGVVYRARHEGLGRVVALKVLAGGPGAGPGGRDRFQQESQTLARLDHPGIVPVYEVGEHEGQAYFAMKLIEGSDLRSRFASMRADMPAGVAALVAVCRAVEFAHQRGVIHRDLKPANILLDSEGVAFVTDFGLAHRLDTDLSLTATGALVGTPAYMAPEQISGGAKVGPATDVWALGVILYELLTGRLPFRGGTPLETLHLIQRGLEVRPRDVAPGVDRNVESICLSCLQSHPDDRYRTADALADDLERWLTRRDVSTPRRNKLRSLRHRMQWLKRPRLLVVLGAAVLVVVVAWLWNREAQRLEVNRAERAAGEGNLDLARSMAAEPPSWLTFAAGADAGARRERLGALLEDHLFGGLECPDSSVSWTWSPSGRWLGCGKRIKDDYAIGCHRPSLVWDVRTAERQPATDRWNDGQLYLQERGGIRLRTDGIMMASCGYSLKVPGAGLDFSSFSDEEWLEWGQQGKGLVEAARGSRWFPEPAVIGVIPLPGGNTKGGRFLLLSSPPASAQDYFERGEALNRVGKYKVTLSSDRRHLHFWQSGRDLQPGREEANLSPLIQATYDLAQGRWVRLVDSDLRVYRPNTEAASGAIPPDVSRCTLLGYPPLLDCCDGLGGPSQSVVLRLSPDGNRLLTVWRKDGAMHVWRMPGSEVTP